MAVLEVQHLKKVYTTRFGGNRVQALSDVNFSVEPREYVAIMGESGSGKTTLLNILAALDKPTGGKVLLKGRDLTTIKEREMAAFRRQNLGFVFQDFNLLDTLTLEENVILAMTLHKKKKQEIQQTVASVMRALGIWEYRKKFPYQVSGGQKQRCACARAIINHPKLILADEPTGALDSQSAGMFLSSLQYMNEALQATILMVTHSVKAASHAQRVLFIKDGEVFHQLYRGNDTNQQMYEKISSTLTMLASGGEAQ